MASIQINNLQPAGTDLFNDSESYLNELKNQELDVISGGSMMTSTTITSTIATATTFPATVTRSDIAQ